MKNPIWVILADEFVEWEFNCQCICLLGGGFSAYGQAKAVVTPFGQAMAGPMVSSNPFLVGIISCSTFYTDEIGSSEPRNIIVDSHLVLLVGC